jgi:hypothetical protein
VKSAARLVDGAGTVVGEGRAYIHLQAPREQSQSAHGTISLDWWDDAADAPARIELALIEDSLPIDVQSDRLSGCMVGRILRYQATWPGHA